MVCLEVIYLEITLGSGTLENDRLRSGTFESGMVGEICSRVVSCGILGSDILENGTLRSNSGTLESMVGVLCLRVVRMEVVLSRVVHSEVVHLELVHSELVHSELVHSRE